jgi:hypothetical protein
MPAPLNEVMAASAVTVQCEELKAVTLVLRETLNTMEVALTGRSLGYGQTMVTTTCAKDKSEFHW